MEEKTKKGDFIEIEFVGKANGEIFDTNIKEEADKLETKIETKPLIVCIGQQMVVKGLDKALEEKKINEPKIIKLNPEEAFGKRNSSLIKTIPKRIFIENKINPVAGMPIALDNTMAKILSTSGGRILVDFNNPLSGKDIEYTFNIKRILKEEDLKEKINALQNFFFRNIFDYDVDKEKKKIIFKDIQLTSILQVFNNRFKEILGYETEILAKPNNEESKEGK